MHRCGQAEAQVDLYPIDISELVDNKGRKSLLRIKGREFDCQKMFPLPLHRKTSSLGY